MSEMIACRGCHKEIHKTAATCPHCGAVQRTKAYKSKVLAAVLALFFGPFGVHRFYLGQWWGIFYLLTFWTLIPGLVSFIECIVFLVRDQQKWDDQYNEGIPGEANNGVAIAIIAIFGVFVFVAILGILAAIAIPAYVDYTNRAQVASALDGSRPLQNAIELYIRENKRYPLNNSQLGIDDPLKLKFATAATGQNGVITITMSNVSGANVRGQSLLLVPKIHNNQIQWVCTQGTLSSTRYLPRQCRE